MVESKTAVPAPAEGDKKDEKRKVVESKEAELVSFLSESRVPAICFQTADDIAKFCVLFARFLAYLDWNSSSSNKSIPEVITALDAR